MYDQRFHRLSWAALLALIALISLYSYPIHFQAALLDRSAISFSAYTFDVKATVEQVCVGNPEAGETEVNIGP